MKIIQAQANINKFFPFHNESSIIIHPKNDLVLLIYDSLIKRIKENDGKPIAWSYNKNLDSDLILENGECYKLWMGCSNLLGNYNDYYLGNTHYNDPFSIKVYDKKDKNKFTYKKDHHICINGPAWITRIKEERAKYIAIKTATIIAH